MTKTTTTITRTTTADTTTTYPLSVRLYSEQNLFLSFFYFWSIPCEWMCVLFLGWSAFPYSVVRHFVVELVVCFAVWLLFLPHFVFKAFLYIYTKQAEMKRLCFQVPVHFINAVSGWRQSRLTKIMTIFGRKITDFRQRAFIISFA